MLRLRAVRLGKPALRIAVVVLVLVLLIFIVVVAAVVDDDDAESVEPIQTQRLCLGLAMALLISQ